MTVVKMGVEMDSEMVVMSVDLLVSLARILE